MNTPDQVPFVPARTPGQVAYEAHLAQFTPNGPPGWYDARMAPWAELTKEQKAHWDKIAFAVIPMPLFQAWHDAKSAKGRTVAREAFLDAMRRRYT